MFLISLWYLGLSNNYIVLGKHSGRHAFRKRLADLGFADLSDDDINSAFIKFKELADKKKEISNADIESIINEEMNTVAQDHYKLLRVQVHCGDHDIPTATISLRDENQNTESSISMLGTGPVDAVYKAIRSLSPEAAESKLLEYTVTSVTAGIDALAEVTVRVQDINSSRIVFGRSANTDVIVASAQAYVNALNRLEVMRDEKLPTKSRFNSLR